MRELLRLWLKDNPEYKGAVGNDAITKRLIKQGVIDEYDAIVRHWKDGQGDPPSRAELEAYQSELNVINELEAARNDKLSQLENLYNTLLETPVTGTISGLTRSLIPNEKTLNYILALTQEVIDDIADGVTIPESTTVEIMFHGQATTDNIGLSDLRKIRKALVRKIRQRENNYKTLKAQINAATTIEELNNITF